MESVSQPQTQSLPPVIKPEGLAALMEVSTRTLRRWELKGLVPRPFLVGSQKYWGRDEILDWMNSQCPNRRLWERLRPKYNRKSD